jgi:hypothetical protein
MVIKIKNLIKAWFFPDNDAIIFSSKEELIIFDMKGKKTTHLPINMECIEQLTITEDYLIYGDYSEESSLEEIVKIYEYPSLRKVRDSTLFDLTCPMAQITNFKNMFFAEGDNYSVVLINPLTDEVIKQFLLPEVFHIDDIFILAINYTHDYLIASIEYDPLNEELPKGYKNAWDSRKNYIKYDEGDPYLFYAIWNIHSGKFHAVIGSISFDYDLPSITETGYLIVDNKIFDLKELKPIHQVELPEDNYLIGAINDNLISLNSLKRNELIFYNLKEQKPVQIFKTSYNIERFVNNSRYVFEYKDYKKGDFPNIIDFKTFLAKLKL